MRQLAIVLLALLVPLAAAQAIPPEKPRPELTMAIGAPEGPVAPGGSTIVNGTLTIRIPGPVPPGEAVVSFRAESSGANVDASPATLSLPFDGSVEDVVFTVPYNVHARLAYGSRVGFVENVQVWASVAETRIIAGQGHAAQFAIEPAYVATFASPRTDARFAFDEDLVARGELPVHVEVNAHSRIVGRAISAPDGCDVVYLSEGTVQAAHDVGRPTEPSSIFVAIECAEAPRMGDGVLLELTVVDMYQRVEADAKQEGWIDFEPFDRTKLAIQELDTPGVGPIAALALLAGLALLLRRRHP